MQPTPRSLSWEEVQGFYVDLAKKLGWKIEPLVDLVDYLTTSPYASSLFPYTSHADLHVGRTRDFSRGDNELTVSYSQNSKTFTFTYQQREDDLHPWSVECPSNEGKDKLKHLLHKRLGWFREG